MNEIPWWRPEVGESEKAAVLGILESQYLNEGAVTEAFEKRIAELVGSRFAIATTSGTSALFLCLKALDIGPGDEVLVPDITFIATANAVTMAGATPVLVDVDEETLSMSPSEMEKAITPKTKAVMPVHVSGRGGTLKEVLDTARRHELEVVEDAAEALLSKYHGKFLGTFGRMGCFSFSPNKTITTGQGGMIVTDSEALHRRLRELKDQGRPVRGTGGDDAHPVVGFNFKLTNLQAAVGMAQLDRLHGRLERQKSFYRRYRDGLEGIAGLRVLPFDVDGGETPQWTDIVCDRRDALDAFLASRKMGCRRFWHPLHTQPPYRAAGFPIASRLSPRALWLPSAFQLSDADVDRVVGSIREFYGVQK